MGMYQGTMPKFYRRPGWLGQGDLIHEIQLSAGGWKAWFGMLTDLQFDLATKGILFDPFEWFPTKAETVDTTISEKHYSLIVSCHLPFDGDQILEMLVPDGNWIWMLQN